MIAALVAAGIAASALQASAELTPARLPPVDQCRGDQGFDRFRSALEDAVTRKDVAALRKLTSPAIQSNFGGEGSWSEFVETWALDSNPSMSSLWKELAEVIKLGCAQIDRDTRVMPGLFEAMGDDVDAFELVVARPGARLRSRPDAKAPIIANLDWSSAIQVETEAPEGWTRVQLLRNGPLGWVESDSLVSPLSYRLVMDLKDGRWVISAFVAGD